MRRSSAAVDHLAELLFLNSDGRLKQGPGQRGFLARNEETGTTRRLCGITNLIKKCYPSPRPMRGMPTQRHLKLFNFQAGVVPIVSNMRRGELVHRHVSHSVFCSPRAAGGCQCARLYGGVSTPALSTEQISVRRCVSAAQQFVSDFDLVPVGAEVKICHRTLPYGTSVDALFQRGDAAAAAGPLSQQRPVVLVSWKTGQGPRNDFELRQHQAQVAFEWATLVGSHRIGVESAYIVYLTAARGTGSSAARGVTGHYFPLAVDASTIGGLYGPLKHKMAGSGKAKKRRRKPATPKKVIVKPTAARKRSSAAAAALARAKTRKRKQR